MDRLFVAFHVSKLQEFEAKDLLRDCVIVSIIALLKTTLFWIENSQVRKTDFYRRLLT